MPRMPDRPKVELKLPFELEAVATPQKVREIVLQAVASDPEVLLLPSPVLDLVEDGAGIQRFELRVWRYKDPKSRRRFISKIYFSVLHALHRCGITPPPVGSTSV